MQRKDYEFLKSLLSDESFCQWLTKANDKNDAGWDEWLAENSDKLEMVDLAKQILDGLPFDFAKKALDPGLVASEWYKLNKSLKIEESAANRPKSSRAVVRKIRFWGWRLVASMAFLTVIGFLLRQYVLNPLVTHQTPFGEQLNLVLDDGTSVDLNANSKLTYRKQNVRKVWLDGEAFFKVEKKPMTGEKFRVVTNDLTVEVLGTAFNVVEKEYRTEVLLEEGRVKLNLKRDFEKELLMKPGELIAFSTRTVEKVEKRQVQSEPLTSWREGVLLFEDTPVFEVMQRVEEIYGWRPVYNDEKLKTRNISTPVPSNDLESTLVLLSKAIGIKIVKVPEDKVLLLH